MEWLIIVFILIFVAGPVMWLKPSPRQKRQMGLRTRARQQGVDVKMAKPPLHYFKGTMPAYRWYYPNSMPGPDFVVLREENASEALAPCHAGWRWRIAPLRPLPEEAQALLMALLERLPRDAVVIESTPQSLTLWWWESQTAERFITYATDFQQLREVLSGLPDEPVSAPLNASVARRS